MDFTLVVVSPFGPHASGDAITDPAGIAAALDGEHADKVVRVKRVPAPAPTASAPAKQATPGTKEH